MHPLLLVTLSFLQAAPEELPALPPTTELVGFTRTEAGALGDYLGNAVLVDFFAHWCAPCARQVPHLNAIGQEYESRGLRVLGVTGDAREDAEPWLELHGAAYPYAFDPELAMQIELGFRPLPHALLIDPTGLLVWRGNPAELTPEVIEGALDGAVAKPAWRWPAEAAALREALRDGELGRARAAVDELFDPELATELRGLIARVAQSRLDLLDAAWARGDFLTVQILVGRGSSQRPASETEAEAKLSAFRARLREDAEARLVLEGQLELREVWRGVSTVSSKAAAGELRDDVQAFAAAYPDTFVVEQATRYVEALEALASILP